MDEIHGNVLMRMLSVTYNTHTHTSRIIIDELFILGILGVGDLTFGGSPLSV